MKNDRLGLERQAHMNHLIKQLLLDKMNESMIVKELFEADVERIHKQFGYSIETKK